MSRNISSKIENGYSFDLGKVIDECFGIYKKIFLIAGVGYIILSIIGVVFFFGIMMVFLGVNNISQWAVEMENNKLEIGFIFGNIIGTALIAALIAPLSAGFLNLCNLAKNNQAITLGPIFELYKSKFLKDIMIGTIIITLSSSVVSTLASFISNPLLGGLIGGIFQLVIAFLTILFLPLVIFGNQNYAEAIQNSVKLVMKKPLYILLAITIAGIGCFVGFIALCIGIFFTFPIFSAMVFAIYDSIVGTEEHDIINEIGMIEE